MLLTPDQVKHMRERLASAGVRPDCPICAAPIDWAASADLVAVVIYFHPTMSQRIQRQLQCVCPTCGALTVFSAAALGLSMYDPLGRLSFKPLLNGA